VRAALVAALVAASLAAVPAEAGFKRPASCRSGETVFNDGRVRLFRINTYIGGESFDQDFSRLDVRTGRVRFGTPRRSDELLLISVAVDEKGGVAYLQEAGAAGDQEQIGYARPLAGGRLGPARRRILIPEDDVRVRTLAVRHGVITWRTKRGAKGSVPTG
jgi:hypothetical protein